MPQRGFLWIVFLFTLTSGARGQTLPADYKVDVTLRPVRWQALPERVSGVCVGPDQRVWYRIDPPKGQAWSFESTKKNIEAEFNQPSPQIVWARPILFERGGRVWFTVRFEDSLFGYDGKTWVEHNLNNPHLTMLTPQRLPTTFPIGRPTTRPTTRPATRPTTRATTRPRLLAPGTHTFQPARPILNLTGSLPNHGTWEGGSANVQVGDTLFFPTNRGVLTYDTRAGRWEHLGMSSLNMPFPGASGPSVFVDDDGKGVTAAMVKTNEQAVWRWRDGKWTRTPAPWPRNLGIGIGVGMSIGVHVIRDGAWVASTVSTPSFVTFDDGRPAGLDALIRQLGADDANQRQRATRALEVQAKFLRSWLSSAAKEADAETAARIKQVLKAAGTDHGFQIGAATLKFTDGLQALGDRRMLITGHDAAMHYRSFVIIPGGDSIEVDPSVRFRPGRTVSSALVTGGGDRVWVPRTDYDHAALLDLKTGKVVGTLPDARFNWLLAIKADGTLFAAPGQPPGGQASKPIMVYQPGARDDIAGAPVTSVATSSGAFCVASDGAVWAERADSGVARFDGKKWTPVPALAGERGVSLLVAGSNGEILFTAGKKVGMVSGDKVVRAATLEQLVEQNKDAVAKAFPAANPADGLSGGSVALFGDPAGNVWLREPAMKVFTDAGWQDLLKETLAAGGKSFQVMSFVPIGDGSRVLVRQIAASRGCLIARVVDGKLVFDPLQHEFSRSLFKAVRDGEGSLYLSGKHLKKLGKDGKDEDLAIGGEPLFCDDDGNLWLREAPLARPTELSVWKSGKGTQKVTVPFLDEYDRFVSDGHGSVYVHTNAGLHQFLRKDGRYELVKTHQLTEVRRAVRAVYSSLGFLVETDLLGFQGEYMLNLVELPH